MLNGFTHPLRLAADPSRVVVRPFHLAWQGSGTDSPRARRLVEAILTLSDKETRRQLGEVFRDFEERHWQTKKVFQKRFEQIRHLLKLDEAKINPKQQQLIGAYFCHEYSYAAAALMNPSVVPHPDQSGLDKHTTRIILSLRAVGEGHISSIAFREGLISAKGRLSLAPQPPFATAADAPDCDGLYEDGPVTVLRNPDSTLSGTVIFPITPAQANGLEDLRMTHFLHDDGSREYVGTYTAYSGRGIRSELMRTCDFKAIDLCPMTGSAAVNKGIALFPRKVGGRYLAIGRQDGQNLFLMQSDKLEEWNGGDLLMQPRFPWEYIQIGNCGSPIETDEGWLVLTHGVGAMRKYAIGSILLDKDDPSKILARSREPILAAFDQDRDGYVPNVVYTCGAMRVGDLLFLPYGLADSSVAFAFIPMAEMMARMD
ncbi:MAG: glycoside hydrolase family 130 protein [Sphingomicrobium sp.]